jgi:hypothetical protein
MKGPDKKDTSIDKIEKPAAVPALPEVPKIKKAPVMLVGTKNDEFDQICKNFKANDI